MSFVDRNSGTVLAEDVPIGYVTLGDSTTGTVATNITLSTGAGG